MTVLCVFSVVGSDSVSGSTKSVISLTRDGSGIFV
jgi:hypothetical protein